MAVVRAELGAQLRVEVARFVPERADSVGVVIMIPVVPCALQKGYLASADALVLERHFCNVWIPSPVVGSANTGLHAGPVVIPNK